MLCCIGIGVLILVLGVLGKKFFRGGVCRLKTDLRDKVVFITGANTGIGEQTAIELAKCGARIIIACRDLKKAKLVVNKIEKIVKHYIRFRNLKRHRSLSCFHWTLAI
jgi:NADPH:quinone reductase-like Zn-dependent oxidoreductase